MRGRRRAGSATRQNPITDSTWPRKRVNVALPNVKSVGGTSWVNTTVKMPGKANSIQVQNGAANTLTSGATALGQTLNLTGKNLLLWWYLEDTTANSLATTGVSLFVSSDGTNFNAVGGSTGLGVGADKHLRDYGRWMPIEIPCGGTAAPLGSASILGMPLFSTGATPDWSAVTHIKLSATAGTRAGIAGPTQASSYLGAIEIIDRPREPVVSFVFDRFNRNNYLEAYPILAAKGWTATARGQVGQLFDSNTSFMTLTMAQDLYANGWDIGIYDYPVSGFTAGDNNFGTASNNQWASRTKASALSDLRQAQQALIDNAMPRGVDHLAGQARKLYLDGYTDIVQPLFNTTDIPQNAEYPAFWPPADPLSLPHKMYVRAVDDNDGSGTANQGRIKQTIDRAYAGNEWLILLFHDVGTAPTPDGFTISAAKFQEIVDYISAAGTKVRTVGQVMHGQV